MENEIVNRFARDNEYEKAEYKGKWKGFDVYEPIYSSEDSYIGIPVVILVKGATVRFSTVDETFKCFNDMEL